MSVLVLTVVTVFISALKTFAEVVVIFVKTDVIRVVSDARVLVTVRILIVGIPSVLAIGLTRIEPFFITAVDRVLDHLSTVAARVVLIAVAIVAIVIDQIVVILRLLKTELISTDLCPISLLQISLIRISALTLKLLVTLLL